MIASENGHLDVLKIFIITGANVNKTNKVGGTCMHVCTLHVYCCILIKFSRLVYIRVYVHVYLACSMYCIIL